jgi:hypothetical protein
MMTKRQEVPHCFDGAAESGFVNAERAGNRSPARPRSAGRILRENGAILLFFGSADWQDLEG